VWTATISMAQRLCVDSQTLRDNDTCTALAHWPAKGTEMCCRSHATARGERGSVPVQSLDNGPAQKVGNRKLAETVVVCFKGRCAKSLGVRPTSTQPPARLLLRACKPRSVRCREWFTTHLRHGPVLEQLAAVEKSHPATKYAPLRDIVPTPPHEQRWLGTECLRHGPMVQFRFPIEIHSTTQVDDQ